METKEGGATGSSAGEDGRLKPVPGTQSLRTADPFMKGFWKDVALESMGEGHLALLLMAGGAGSRLGFAGPKGKYEMDLPSNASLFELHATRLRSLERMASLSMGLDLNAGDASVRIPLYVMTSPANHDETVAFFKENAYFGLSPSHVTCFPQGVLPCIGQGGEMILETPSKLSVAPDGNGGIYRALSDNGILDDMQARGTTYVHTICVDNALVRGLDPHFMGYVITQNADVGSLVCPKRDWQEKVNLRCVCVFVRVCVCVMRGMFLPRRCFNSRGFEGSAREYGDELLQYDSCILNRISFAQHRPSSFGYYL